MKLLIEIPDNVYKNCCTVPLNSVERAVKNGKPLDSVLNEIRAEIPKLTCGDNEYRQALVKVADVIKCIDKYKAESDIKSRKECPYKPCINSEDGCEEWTAGCPCVYYKAESEET